MPSALLNVIPPQLVTNAAAKCTFTNQNSQLAGGVVVPANCVVLLTSLKCNNYTAGGITLQVWRGTAADNTHTLLGGAIVIPPASLGSPGVQLLDAPLVLMPGDSIWAEAGAGASLNIWGDGQLITQ